MPFTIWSNVVMEIGFAYLKSHQPFAEEEFRKSVWDQLNALPGVVLKPGSWNTLPSIPIKVLVQEDTRKTFLSTMERVIQQIRAGAKQDEESS